MSTGPPGQSHKIYDLTRLKNNSLDHPSQPQALPNESELSHLRQLVGIYRQHIEKVSQMIGRKTRTAGENSQEVQLQTLSEDLDGIEHDLAALKESKVEQVPVIVEKFIEIEKPV
jgi:phosphoglycerate-specific signal transduction histidine kinase